MSPLKISILLHYHTTPGDYAAWAMEWNEGHATSRAVRETIDCFVHHGLLKSKFGDVTWAIRESAAGVEGPYFSITDKGSAMVEHLCAVQIPICKWVQP